MAREGGPVTVCVINLKGGVGKSTISALLARRGYGSRALDVLAIDLDPQANLSQGLMHNDYERFLTQKRPSIVEVFNGYIPPTAKATAPKPLLPNNTFETIAEAQARSLQLIPSRFDFSDNLLGALRPDPKALARYLSSNFQHKDLIIIDCSLPSQYSLLQPTTPAGWSSFQSSPNTSPRSVSPSFGNRSTTSRIRIAGKPLPLPVWL